jgi:Aspartyl protease
MKFSITYMLALGFGASSFSQSGTMNQGEMTVKNVYHEISISNSDDEITQSVGLRGKTFNFIFDTGAPLAISKELQKELKYSMLNKAPLKDAHNKSDTIEIVMVDTIRFGNLTFKNIPAVVIDFQNSPIACRHIDGIIGSNIARFLTVQFNLKEGKIVLTDNLEKLIVATKANPIPIYPDGQSNAFLVVGFGKNLRDTAHFDSGMGKIYDMNIGKARQLISSLGSKPNTVYKGFGISGQGILGNAKWEDVFIINAEISLGSNRIAASQIGTSQTASRIGRELMNYGTLTINYIDKHYYFDAYPKRLNKARANFGFTILTETGKVTAGVVWEGTPAHKNGLTSGSKITSINKKKILNLTTCEAEEILTKEFRKEKIQVEFLKDQTKHTITLDRLN